MVYTMYELHPTPIGAAGWSTMAMTSSHHLNRLLVAATLLLVPVTITTAPNSASVPSRLWESSTGTYFNDSYLIGNGRLGAALPGTAQMEKIWINEDSF